MAKLAEWAEAIMSPGPLGLAIGILLVLTLPIFVHFFVHRPSGLTQLPSILLAGSSESGKTSLLTLVSSLDHLLLVEIDDPVVRAWKERGDTYIPNTSSCRMLPTHIHNCGVFTVPIDQ